MQPVVPALVTAYVIVAPPSAEAQVEGVRGELVVNTDVVGDHDTDWVDRACPDTVAEPEEYAARVVCTVTVADAPAARPVTVSGSVDPDGVPATTDPDPTVGVHE